MKKIDDRPRGHGLRRARGRTALRATAIGGVTLAMLGAGAAFAAGYEPADPGAGPGTGDGAELSAAAADQYVTGNSTGFTKGPDETYTRKRVVTTGRGINYVDYARTYRKLPVFVGGDAVVVTDRTGAVTSSTTGAAPIDITTTPKITAVRATTVARSRHRGTVAGKPTLGVVADGAPKLVWEVVVDGVAKGTPSRVHSYVDARTGRYAGAWNEITTGTGTGHYNGTVQIGTAPAAGGFELRDTARGGMRTLDEATGRILTDADDTWGTGAGADRVTGAVDTQYAGATMWDMLKAKFGRDGIDGRGGTATMFVGLADVNAFYSCAGTADAGRDQTKYGRTADGARQVNSIDVVAHELGHGVFCHTPGGSRGTSNETGGLNEGTGDIFGTMAEHFAANPNDPPDYLVGEKVNLSGRGPIRNMIDPAKVGDPACWSTRIPQTEVHSAAGPLTHWFYLAAEGSRPAGGSVSPTCDGSTVTGIGLWPAGDIYYHALLRKTSGWTYSKARQATLEAARELHPDSCTEFAAVKAAWDAVSVPAQQDPTCVVTPKPETPASSSPTSSAPAPSAPATVAPGVGTATAPDIDGAKVKAHVVALDRIARANGGNRAHGTQGYKASLDYVRGALDAAGYTTRIQQFSNRGTTGYNLIADLPGRGDPNRVVMLGAHLDSVATGPGVNDNATGSAGILQVALDYAASGATGDKAIRFGWWGAEENGLVGSKAYVASLRAADRSAVTAYLNFDMIGSPNPGYFTYTGDTRGGFIADALTDGFTAEKVASEGADINGRSDHASFAAAGIPTGGTAALSLATAMSGAQAAKWGGTAGKPFDPCYHKACDTLANVNDVALDTHTDVAAYAAWRLTGVPAAGTPQSSVPPTSAPQPSDPQPSVPQPSASGTSEPGPQPSAPQPSASGPAAPRPTAPLPPVTSPPVPTPGGTRVENRAAFAIRDRSTVESPITVRRGGPAPRTLKVDVDITHSFRGDLQVDLVAPDGTAYRLKSASRFDRADNVRVSRRVDASAESADGTWKLRVRDLRSGDRGTLNAWALTF